jgi:hypothetical protein
MLARWKKPEGGRASIIHASRLKLTPCTKKSVTAYASCSAMPWRWMCTVLLWGMLMEKVLVVLSTGMHVWGEAVKSSSCTSVG